MSNTPESMDEDEYRANIAALFSDADDYYKNEVEPEQLAASKFYNGDPLGTEEDGRSQFVMRVAYDVVESMVPSLLRTFDGPEEVMEVVPWDEMEVDTARDMTDAVNHIFKTRNNSYRILEDAFNDALIRKTGCLTWAAEHKTVPKVNTYPGMDRDMIDALKAQDDVEIVSEEEEEDEDDEPPTANQANPNHPDTDPAILKALSGPQAEKPEALKTFTVKIRRMVKQTVFKVDCFPPEQLRIWAAAGSVDTILS